MKKIMIFAGIGLVVVIGIVLVLVFVVFKKDDGESKKPVEEFLFTCEEQYVNIPLGDDEGNTKILKLQMTIAYTDTDYEELLTNRHLEILDFLNGYFRDTTVETVNRKNGKERVKEEILENLVEMFETDSDNFTKVLFTQFIIQ